MPFISVITACLIAASSAVDPEHERGGVKYNIGYRHTTDTLDYSDNTREHSVYRGTVLFSRESMFNYTRVHIKRGGENEDGEERYTWNLVLDDASDNYRLIAGNFFANFGAGMLIGKKAYMSSDIHPSGISASRRVPLSPCSSGNPVFAFHGAGGMYTFNHGIITSRAVAFYSIRNRFAEWDSSDSIRSGSSYNAISGRHEDCARHPEPVEIHDWAFMYEFSVEEVLRVQAYGLRSFFQLPGGEKFLWNHDNSTNEGAAEKGYGVYGVFIEYKDDYLDMFYEGGYTYRKYERDKGGDYTEGGFGSLFGFRFRHPDVRFAATGKTGDENLHTRYGSGRVDPEKAMHLSLRLRFARGLWAGGEYSSEKRVKPPYRRNSLPSKRSEKGFFEYRFKRNHLIEGGGVRTETDSGEDIAEYKRVAGRYTFSNDRLQTGARGSMQFRTGKEISHMYALTGRAGPFRGFTAGLEFWDITAGEGNPVYSSAGMFGCISGGGFVYETSRTVSTRLAFRRKELNLLGGYLWRFDKDGLIENRMHFSGEYTF